MSTSEPRSFRFLSGWVGVRIARRWELETHDTQSTSHGRTHPPETPPGSPPSGREEGFPGAQCPGQAAGGGAWRASTWEEPVRVPASPAGGKVASTPRIHLAGLFEHLCFSAFRALSPPSGWPLGSRPPAGIGSGATQKRPAVFWSRWEETAPPLAETRDVPAGTQYS